MNKIENRFISYGIANDENELVEFIDNAVNVGNLFFEEESKNNGERAVDFAIGFCEGNIFRVITIINEMLQSNYSDEEIVKITKISKERLNSIKMATMSCCN